MNDAATIETVTFEHGWLIENADSQTSAPLYWTADTDATATGSPGWTTDHMKALRFARITDAQTYADAHIPTGGVRVAEHMWDVDTKGVGHAVLAPESATMG